MPDPPKAFILERLRKLLTQLDEKFQNEGLMPEETQVREWVRQFISLEKVFSEQFPDEELWAGVGNQDLTLISQEVARARDRLHLLEGDAAAVGKLLEAVGRLAVEMKAITDKVNHELDAKESGEDAGLR